MRRAPSSQRRSAHRVLGRLVIRGSSRGRRPPRGVWAGDPDERLEIYPAHCVSCATSLHGAHEQDRRRRRGCHAGTTADNEPHAAMFAVGSNGATADQIDGWQNSITIGRYPDYIRDAQASGPQVFEVDDHPFGEMVDREDRFGNMRDGANSGSETLGSWTKPSPIVVLSG